VHRCRAVFAGAGTRCCMQGGGCNGPSGLRSTGDPAHACSAAYNSHSREPDDLLHAPSFGLSFAVGRWEYGAAQRRIQRRRASRPVLAPFAPLARPHTRAHPLQHSPRHLHPTYTSTPLIHLSLSTHADIRTLLIFARSHRARRSPPPTAASSRTVLAHPMQCNAMQCSSNDEHESDALDVVHPAD